ncbi:class I SAM-dependent methyltransferase [Dasania sp. GY-MA-18]|uniref:Class I SAM-dependent methyltransferase n=1 Tax=Dasania phycosphaerae TaxID=2950436 RepID=A0A9J6RJX9_9GAMM|nr:MULTISPECIES: class I SAM-dependent methyltransferase [Dasania]MCR8922237.1 class I SAM-dependent methyltransferase [Dasania sp. GY-MA-18]MCZ0864665.1 class I SAM-dependent methyltransferase [Dasania phycosphaerae]MCZ0868393.1 class I SAM-dependent methyltransferase [Dasania phycosphaerae]
MPCTLCGLTGNPEFHRDRRRSYQRCQRCHLVYVPAEYWLSAEQEKAEYDLHQNHAQDEGYRRFLSRLTDPLQNKIAANAQGLDFGCGPGPVLAQIMGEAGWPMSVYDIFYYPQEQRLSQTYDFITATEVVEHLHSPATVLPRLWELINEQGYLAIMTKLVQDQAAFARWHYKNDPTHICFFSRETFCYIAGLWRAQLEFIGNDVIFFKKVTGHEGS